MILRHFYKILFTLLLLTLPLSLYANNVTVSNISLTDPDGAGETINVEFDISWGIHGAAQLIMMLPGYL